MKTKMNRKQFIKGLLAVPLAGLAAVKTFSKKPKLETTRTFNWHEVNGIMPPRQPPFTEKESEAIYKEMRAGAMQSIRDARRHGMRL